MAAISVGEGMYPDQGMVKPCGQFIRWKRIVFDPISRIAEQLIQLDRLARRERRGLAP
jgi:hypothetical protein